MPKEVQEVIDSQAQEAFLNADPDNDMKKIRQTLLDNIDIISQADFDNAIQQVANRVDIHLKDKKYAVIFDSKAHSSRRWIWNKMIRYISHQPTFATFLSKAEKLSRFASLKQIFRSNIRDIVIPDDAIYSGKQVKDTLSLINEAYTEYLSEQSQENPANNSGLPLNIFLSVPCLSEKYAQVDSSIQPPLEITSRWSNNINLTIIYYKPMKQLKSILKDEDWDLLAKRDYNLATETEVNEHTQTIPNSIQLAGYSPVETELHQQQTLTVLPHKVADSHSFATVLIPLLGLPSPQTPYKDASSDYYKQEDIDFSKYWEIYCTNHT